MKILITGGAGFIGSNLADRLIKDGYVVIIVDNLSSGKREQVPKQAVFYEADITSEKMVEIIQHEQPQIISHHAAQIDVRKSVADPGFDAHVNIQGLINLMEGAKHAGVKKVIFASSGGAIYADAKELPTPEDYPPCPMSPYGVSKLSGEYYLNFYQETCGIKTIALRYGNVYGPRQDPHGEAGVVSIFIGKLLEGEQPRIFGDGEQQRDYVFVEDIVTANSLALEKDTTGVINIGTGIGTTVNMLLLKIQEVMKTSFEPIKAPPRVGEARASVLNSELAKTKLGWVPNYSLEDGIAKTIQFFSPQAIRAHSS